MSRKLGALILALGLSFAPAAMADVAGGPGTGGSGGEGGADGGGGTGGKKDDGGCVTATPGTASRSAAVLVGLGLLLAIPAARRRRSRKPR